MAQDRTKLWYLKNIEVFRNLNDEEVRMIDRFSVMREIKEGETLYLQGSSDKSIYILKKGVVKIIKLTPQGKEIILDIFKGGSIFGEMPFAELEERNESARAVEDGAGGSRTDASAPPLRANASSAPFERRWPRIRRQANRRPTRVRGCASTRRG